MPKNHRSGESWMLTLLKVSTSNEIWISRSPPVVTTDPDRQRSRRPVETCRRRLESVQEADSALSMRRRLENCPLVAGQHRQPGLQVGGVIRPRLQLRCDAQIGA